MAYRRKKQSLTITIITLVLLALFTLLKPQAPVSQKIADTNPGSYKIDHFVDGDTIAVI